MITSWMKLTRACGGMILLAAAFAAGTASADMPIPLPQFNFIVIQGTTPVPGCTSFAGAPNGGTCGAENSGPGFAATSGGIGTASYLPVTPGGTVLGNGTAVDATSTWRSGLTVYSAATLAYSFEVQAPANVEYIPIDILSTGLLKDVGDANASLSLTVDGPGSAAPLLDLSAHCAEGQCVSSWGTPGQTLTNMLCVANGDSYLITIGAVTSASQGWGSGANAASATLDPVIKLDPPYPSTCQSPADPSQIHILTSPGTSTGTISGVPEPSELSLAVLAALGLGYGARRRRPGGLARS
jgi:hypothetical protein